jgi:hypothetical protein
MNSLILFQKVVINLLNGFKVQIIHKAMPEKNIVTDIISKNYQPMRNWSLRNRAGGSHFYTNEKCSTNT